MDVRVPRFIARTKVVGGKVSDAKVRTEEGKADVVMLESIRMQPCAGCPFVNASFSE